MHLLSKLTKGTAVILLLCAVLTGCNDTGSHGSSADNSISTPASVSQSDTAPQESEPDAPEKTDISSSVQTTTKIAPVLSSPAEQTDEVSHPPESSEPDITLPNESAEASDEAPLNSQPPATSSTVPEQTTTPPATTTTAEPPKPPVPVVIPDVKVPSSPGTAVINADGGVGTIDYSNASEGYISVTYNGSAPKVKLRIVYGDYIYNHNVPIDGTTKFFPLSCGSGSYKIELYENAEGNLYSTAASETITVNIADETEVFLYPNYYVEFSKSSASVKKGAELCAGIDGTIEKIAAIFEYVADAVSYDKVLAANPPSGYVPYPDNTLASQKGICFDYASLFAAMTRSQGIPTRLCIGYASPDIYHAWNEVYTEETGWITPELFLKKKGYNLVDATFYSGASNKEQISEYISNGANYSVIYYY